MESLLLTFMSHGISDFMLQSTNLVRRKAQRRLSAFLIHGLITFSVLLLVLHFYCPGTMLPFVSVLTVLHLALDYIKSLFTSKNKHGLDLLWFIVDQLGHFFMIIVVWQWFDLTVNPALATFYQNLLSPKTLTVLTQPAKPPLNYSFNQLLMIVNGYIYICAGGVFLVRKILNSIEKQPLRIEHNTKIQSGTYIGILERFLILTFVQCQSLPSVAFILTAKSIARFNELNDKSFAEYYLMGTLTSATMAIGGGFLLNFLAAWIR